MIPLDSRTDPRNLVLLPEPSAALPPASAQDGAAPLRAGLRVDRAHPFFFDHPLDHVPGLLLLEGAVQLVQRAAPRGGFVSGIEAQFLRYALFDAPITLDAHPLDACSSRVLLRQSGQDRAEVTVTLAPHDRPAPIGPQRPPPGLAPAPMAPLNKTRPENVLISAPRQEGGQISAWLLPQPQPCGPPCRLADSAMALHPLHLLEAFMQVQRFLNSQRADAGRMRDILTGVSLHQSAPVIGGAAALRIDGPTTLTETRPSRFSRVATIANGGIPFAHCALHTALAGGRALSQTG